jgi:hypothetical protein
MWPKRGSGVVVSCVVLAMLGVVPASAAPNGKIAFEQDTEDAPVSPSL